MPFQRDLDGIHNHQARVVNGGQRLVDSDGQDIIGFITSVTLLDGEMDVPGATYGERILVMRASSRYAKGATVSDGATTWRITGVEADEGAYKHMLERRG